MTATPRLLIFVPAYQDPQPRTLESLFVLGQWMTSNGIRANLCTLQCGDIVESRNTALTIFYDVYKDCTHLLMVDSDMGFEHTLIKNMLKFNNGVTGCFYAKRQFPATAVGKCLAPEESELKDGFMKVRGTGAGVLLIKRDAIKQMIEKLPEIVDETPIERQDTYVILKEYQCKRYLRPFDRIKHPAGGSLSEDLSFCERWLQSGGEMWANVDHLIDHIGTYNFAIRYADFLETQARDEKAA